MNKNRRQAALRLAMGCASLATTTVATRTARAASVSDRIADSDSVSNPHSVERQNAPVGPRRNPRSVARPIEIAFAESEDVLPNPDCGLAGWADIPLQGSSSFLVRDGLPRAWSLGNRLLRMQVDLKDYVQNDRIDDSVLQRLEDSLQILRASGMKAILRFQYSAPDEANYRKAVDAPLARVLAHIRQLGPTVTAQRNCIAYIEAGFIGAWGEWHTSSNNLTQPANAAQIRDALLTHFPTDRRLLLRQPSVLRRWTEARGHGRDAVLDRMHESHLGMHNDSILSLGASNGNTWLNESDRRWVEQATEWIVYGGEVAAGGLNVQRADQVENEFRRLHQCWINGGGKFSFVDDLLRRANCRDAVVSRIGYRLVLHSLQAPGSVTQREPFEVTLRWRNDGYARVPYSRDAQLLLIRLPESAQNLVGGAEVPNAQTRSPGSTSEPMTGSIIGSSTASFVQTTSGPSAGATVAATAGRSADSSAAAIASLKTTAQASFGNASRPHTVSVALTGSDVRQLAPQSTDPTTFRVKLRLPAAARPGVYELALRLPDPAVQLADDSRFSIRPSTREQNGQRWDPTLGCLRLGRVLRVTGNDGA